MYLPFPNLTIPWRPLGAKPTPQGRINTEQAAARAFLLRRMLRASHAPCTEGVDARAPAAAMLAGMALCKVKVPRTVQRWPGGQACAVMCMEPVGEQLLRAISCIVAANGDNGMGSGVLSKQLLGQGTEGRLSRGGVQLLPTQHQPLARHSWEQDKQLSPGNRQQQQGKGKASSGN